MVFAFILDFSSSVMSDGFMPWSFYAWAAQLYRISSCVSPVVVQLQSKPTSAHLNFSIDRIRCSTCL